MVAATKGSDGSGREVPSSKLIAVKLPLGFRFPEAALGYRVQTTQNGRSGFPKAACQPKADFSNWTALKPPLANSPSRPEADTWLPLPKADIARRQWSGILKLLY